MKRTLSVIFVSAVTEVIVTRQATVIAKDDAEVLSVHLYNFHDVIARMQADVDITDYGTCRWTCTPCYVVH